jgi:hypothetical protein
MKALGMDRSQCNKLATLLKLWIAEFDPVSGATALPHGIQNVKGTRHGCLPRQNRDKQPTNNTKGQPLFIVERYQ